MLKLLFSFQNNWKLLDGIGILICHTYLWCVGPSYILHMCTCLAAWLSSTCSWHPLGSFPLGNRGCRNSFINVLLTARIICALVSFATENCNLLIVQPFSWPNFCLFLSPSWDLSPTVTQYSSHRTQRMHITSSVTYPRWCLIKFIVLRVFLGGVWNLLACSIVIKVFFIKFKVKSKSIKRGII